MALLYRFHTIENLNELAREFPSLRGKVQAFPGLEARDAVIWRCCDVLYALGKPVNALALRPLLRAEGFYVSSDSISAPSHSFRAAEVEQGVADWLAFHTNMREAMRRALYQEV